MCIRDRSSVANMRRTRKINDYEFSYMNILAVMLLVMFFCVFFGYSWFVITTNTTSVTNINSQVNTVFQIQVTSQLAIFYIMAYKEVLQGNPKLVKANFYFTNSTNAATRVGGTKRNVAQVLANAKTFFLSQSEDLIPEFNHYFDGDLCVDSPLGLPCPERYRDVLSKGLVNALPFAYGRLWQWLLDMDEEVKKRGIYGMTDEHLADFDDLNYFIAETFTHMDSKVKKVNRTNLVTQGIVEVASWMVIAILLARAIWSRIVYRLIQNIINSRLFIWILPLNLLQSDERVVAVLSNKNFIQSYQQY
eukprot:TRINITY_DN17143_c0_g1_i1.p1 TRINITY_DN17143_c0_g1~~TRINITY_DN17143_c0_g1_i1.p1  ORF type:complete len:305 (+),score=61.50 TRINITY_DN17143_c0_g1_i1:63-977(+)